MAFLPRSFMNGIVRSGAGSAGIRCSRSAVSKEYADKLLLVGIVERTVVAVPDGTVETVVPRVLAGGLESGMAHGVAPFRDGGAHDPHLRGGESGARRGGRGWKLILGLILAPRCTMMRTVFTGENSSVG